MRHYSHKNRQKWRKAIFGILAIGSFLASPVLILAAPGDLDNSFGNGGIVVTSFSSGWPYSDFPRSTAVQPDGKILVCGRITQFDPSSEEQVPVSFFLARYNPNGALDASFGKNGRIVAPIDPFGEFVGEDVAIQQDGKFVTVGYKTINGTDHFAVHRHNSNGKLDATFGIGGKAITPIGDLSRADDVAILPDGKIIVVGYATLPSDFSHFAIVRYTSNGTLDRSFGDGGTIVTPIIPSGLARSVMPRSDGKIVVAGYLGYLVGGVPGYAVARYNADGKLDSGFGAGGIVNQTLLNFEFNDAVLQPDGRIVVAGMGGSPYTALVIVRHNADGSIDTSFSQNGFFTPPTGFTSGFGGGLAVQLDGKIIPFGVYFSEAAALRINLDGSLDATFGSNGIANTHFSNSIGVAGTVQQNGRILLLGWSAGGGIMLARFFG